MKPGIQYLNEKQVSEITQLALSTLRNYRCAGRGPAYVKCGSAVRYKEDDVIRFMERNRVTPRNDQ